MIVYNLPFQYRVLASSMADVIWQSILSKNLNAGHEEDAATLLYGTHENVSPLEVEDILLPLTNELLEDDTATVSMVELSSTAMGCQSSDVGGSNGGNNGKRQ